MKVQHRMTRGFDHCLLHQPKRVLMMTEFEMGPTERIEKIRIGGVPLKISSQGHGTLQTVRISLSIKKGGGEIIGSPQRLGVILEDEFILCDRLIDTTSSPQTSRQYHSKRFIGWTCLQCLPNPRITRIYLLFRVEMPSEMDPR